MKTRNRCLLFTALMLSNVCAEPWWKTPHLKWQLFTALPAVGNLDPYAPTQWKIQERSSNGIPKFFAVTDANNKFSFHTANASTSPTFTSGSASLPWYTGVLSTAMCRWNKPYDELFIGSTSGVWRLDEDENRFVSIFSWTYNPSDIVSLGNAIFGCVRGYGDKSGLYVWNPDGTSVLTSGGGTPMIWGDPISGRHGVSSYHFSRAISLTESITLGNGEYSYDGFASPGKWPIGIRNDGNSFHISTFYPYSGNTIIAETTYENSYYLYIGTLGGTFYPLSLPIAPLYQFCETFFYSPSTRLLVAGHLPSNQIFYTVLPGPGEDLVPKLDIQVVGANAMLSWNWNSQQSPARLEKSSDLSTWQNASQTPIKVGGRMQVIVPRTSVKEFYRLAVP